MPGLTAKLSVAKYTGTGNSAIASSIGANIWQRSLIYSCIIFCILLALGNQVYTEVMTRHLMVTQDLPVILTICAALLLLGGQVKLLPDAGANAVNGVNGPVEPPMRLPALNLPVIMLIGTAIIGIAITGHYVILHAYAFSRDEQMALFDAEIFRNGQFIAALPDFWKPMSSALNEIFTLESPRGQGWVSSYRPVNSILQMAFGVAASPLLTVLGLIATWRVTLHLWPGDSAQDRETRWITLILFCVSTQMLALSMTSYAMAGHLGLNMVWLWLFLNNRWYSHIGALVTGFLATGLHQIAYHPLFAGPILALLLWQRRWGLAAVYAAVYAAIIGFWGLYAKIPISMLDLPMDAVTRDTNGFLLTRLQWALGQMGWEYIAFQAANLLRYFAWQHVLLLPLLLIGGAGIIRSRDPLKIVLLLSFVTIIIAKLLLRPYQGHGWGFRYMHGVMALGCIVAAMGWHQLRSEGLARTRHFVAATLFTLLLPMPWLLWQASQFSGAYAKIDREIAALNYEVVIIDDVAGPFSNDLVYNSPYLNKGSIRLRASVIAPNQLAQICDRYSVTFVGEERFAPILQAFGWSKPLLSPEYDQLREQAEAIGCIPRLSSIR